jgi:hypothetical protein
MVQGKNEGIKDEGNINTEWKENRETNDKRKQEAIKQRQEGSTEAGKE